VIPAEHLQRFAEAAEANARNTTPAPPAEPATRTLPTVGDLPAPVVTSIPSGLLSDDDGGEPMTAYSHVDLSILCRSYLMHDPRDYEDGQPCRDCGRDATEYHPA
jgi:hypothetical protein